MFPLLFCTLHSKMITISISHMIYISNFWQDFIFSPYLIGSKSRLLLLYFCELFTSIYLRFILAGFNNIPLWNGSNFVFVVDYDAAAIWSTSNKWTRTLNVRVNWFWVSFNSDVRRRIDFNMFFLVYLSLVDQIAAAS